jgi:hypothetical protein
LRKAHVCHAREHERDCQIRCERAPCHFQFLL